MSKKKKEFTPMVKLMENVALVLKDKVLNTNNKDLFDKIIKKAAQPKPRGSK